MPVAKKLIALSIAEGIGSLAMHSAKVLYAVGKSEISLKVAKSLTS